MIGDIMSVSRLRMAADGQGVSTLVAFFDCPLQCKYCINSSCHEDKNFLLQTPRAAYKPEELLEVLKKDEIYYLMTGGGVVFGGGEPLLQSAFIHDVCQMMDSRWAKRIETSLNVPWRYVEPLLEDMDEWIIDIKDMDRSIYEEYTGVNNEKVIQNLFRIKDVVSVKRLHIRIPNIPGYNTKEDVERSVEWIKDVLGVEPEVFDYYALPHTVKEPDGLHGIMMRMRKNKGKQVFL